MLLVHYREQRSGVAAAIKNLSGNKATNGAKRVINDCEPGLH
jgi:hypothetical protein